MSASDHSSIVGTLLELVHPKYSPRSFPAPLSGRIIIGADSQARDDSGAWNVWNKNQSWQSATVGDLHMGWARERFTLRQMMVAVAIVAIEFALITAVARAIDHEPTANDWLAGTAVVTVPIS